MDALLAYDDDTFLTGSSDGIIRILTLQPNNMLGVLGEHGGAPGWTGRECGRGGRRERGERSIRRSIHLEGRAACSPSPFGTGP